MEHLQCDTWPAACLQVYTGDGKGKSTAAFGLALRAAGRGLAVFIGQFMKNFEYGELYGFKALGDLVTVEQFGSPQCIPWRETPARADVDLAQRGLRRSREALLGGEYRIVILDEINVACHFKLISERELSELVEARPAEVELVCTGRKAPASLIERADLVTEMREVKHPFSSVNLQARDGIER